MRAPQPVAEKLTISRLAQLAGVNLETIRYYERQGLLPAPPRTAAGYRVFPSEAARRLRFIKRAQELGFSLSEISELLSIRVKPGAKQADVRVRTEAKIADIDQKIRTLHAMKKSLRLLTSVGLGFLISTPYLFPLTVAFLAVAVASLGFRASSRRGLGPLCMGVAAAAVILGGKFYLESTTATYAGVGFLVVASVWNSWAGPSKLIAF